MDKVIFDVRRKMVLDFIEEKNYKPSTRGPGWTDHWCICCRPTAWQSSQVWKG